MVRSDAQDKDENVMSHAVAMSIAELTPAWRALEAQSSAKLRVVDSEPHYRAMTRLMHELLDEIGDDKKHPLMGLLDIVTMLIEDYEKRNVEPPDADPVAVLKFLMEQHGLRQIDLADLFGSQSNVSEILAGKRQINARQAKALAKRFRTSTAVFV